MSFSQLTVRIHLNEQEIGKRHLRVLDSWSLQDVFNSLEESKSGYLYSVVSTTCPMSINQLVGRLSKEEKESIDFSMYKDPVIWVTLNYQRVQLILHDKERVRDLFDNGQWQLNFHKKPDSTLGFVARFLSHDDPYFELDFLSDFDLTLKEWARKYNVQENAKLEVKFFYSIWKANFLDKQKISDL